MHRILYINFVEDLTKEEYLKFMCQNKGSCCNINHLKKFTYNRPEGEKKKIAPHKATLKERIKKKDDKCKNDDNEYDPLHLNFE